MEWLQAFGGIFWIQGKAGCGKSTLMKYLFNESRTLSYLTNSSVPPTSSKLSEARSLGEARSLCVAGLFFPAKGATLEKSPMGLLMSILSQVLGKFPALIAIAFPGLWKEMLDPFNTRKKPLSWSISDLRSALQEVAHNRDTQAKGDVCLFIDGLDEYDGDHAELAEILDSLILPSGNRQLCFKVCVASRPLTVFDRCFKSYPGLRLQDLTAHDIRHYATSRLNLHEDREVLFSGTGDKFGPIDVIEEVVRKSSGVFLWVTLTVKSLEAGLDNGDNVSELKARLDETPADLQELYLAILRDVEPRYRWQAADLLRIIRYAEEPLTLLELAFASDVPTSAVALNIRARDDTKLSAKCRITEKRLRSRCGSLLDISERASHDQNFNGGIDYGPDLDLSFHDRFPIGAVMRKFVTFFHLSVREFLDLPSAWQVLDADRTSTPDPYIYLICSQVSLFSLDDRSWFVHSHSESPFSIPEKSYHVIWDIIQYGLMVREDSSGVLVALLDKMHATLTEYNSRISEPWFIPLTSSPVSTGNHILFRTWPKEWHGDFLAFAASYGLIKYVRTKIEANPTALAAPRRRPLACYAIDAGWHIPGSRVPHTSIVRYLLNKGARLDQIFEGKTLWQFAVTCACDDGLERPESRDRWLELLQLLLGFGADPNLQKSIKIVQSVGNRLHFEASSLLVLTDLFRNFLLDSNVQQLLATVKSRSTIPPDEQASIDAIEPSTKRQRTTY